MALMEEWYKDDKIKVDCKLIEEYIKNYNKTNEP